MFVQEGLVPAGEFGEECRGHRIGIRSNCILDMIHFLLGIGMLIDFQLLVEEGVGLLYDGPFNHFTQLYFSW